MWLLPPKKYSSKSFPFFPRILKTIENKNRSFELASKSMYWLVLLTKQFKFAEIWAMADEHSMVAEDVTMQVPHIQFFKTIINACKENRELLPSLPETLECLLESGSTKLIQIDQFEEYRYEGLSILYDPAFVCNVLHKHVHKCYHERGDSTGCKTNMWNCRPGSRGTCGNGGTYRTQRNDCFITTPFGWRDEITSYNYVFTMTERFLARGLLDSYCRQQYRPLNTVFNFRNKKSTNRGLPAC